MNKKKYNVGSFVTGCVTGVKEYGIFVGLDNHYSGLIHISEISNSFVKNIMDYVYIGETIKIKVLEVDEKKSHLKLSIKGFDYRISRKRKNTIIETEHGFDTLKLNLPKWIALKGGLILSKNKKN